MKSVVVLFALVAGVYCARSYSNKYDNVNIDQILKNTRLLDNYIKCLLDLGRCTPEGQELKVIVPDAIREGCTSCSEKQKTASEKVIKFLVKNRRRDWDKLTKKYDPNGEYREKYSHYLDIPFPN